MGHLSSSGAVLQQRMMDDFSSAVGRIESAGIIEDDLPGSLGIQTQPLPGKNSYIATA